GAVLLLDEAADLSAGLRPGLPVRRVATQETGCGLHGFSLKGTEAIVPAGPSVATGRRVKDPRPGPRAGLRATAPCTPRLRLRERQSISGCSGQTTTRRSGIGKRPRSWRALSPSPAGTHARPRGPSTIVACCRACRTGPTGSASSSPRGG